MPWSTRQLAALAGTSARTIRHYHDIALLPEPERLSNGYKQYNIPHLVAVLRIKRMSSLGFSLEQIAKMLDNPTRSREALEALHEELTDAIARLDQTRAEVAAALESGLPPDIAPDADVAMDALGHDPYGRSIAIIITHLLNSSHTAETFAALADSTGGLSALNDEFGRLSPGAAADEVEDLAMKVAQIAAEFLSERPHLFSISRAESPDDDRAVAVVIEAMKSGLNAAQTQVLDRVVRELQQRFAAGMT